MKNKSLFAQIVLLFVISFLCIATTVITAFLAGSVDKTIFDFSNLNIANMVPVFILGGLISCFIIVVVVLFTSRMFFYKVKENFEDNIKKNIDN